MTFAFVIPGALRQYANGHGEVRVEGHATSVSEALALLWTRCPAIRDRVLDERDDVRPHINIFVDGENIRQSVGLASPIRDGAEVIILPAVSGGGPYLRACRSSDDGACRLTQERR